MASEISPKAEIATNVKIGDNCKIYPFAYIEEDVVIGDNCIHQCSYRHAHGKQQPSIPRFGARSYSTRL